MRSPRIFLRLLSAAAALFVSMGSLAPAAWAGTAPGVPDCGEQFGFLGTASMARFNPLLGGDMATVDLVGGLADPWAAKLGEDQYAAWEIRIEDAWGNVARSWHGSTPLPAGGRVPVRVQWDGTDQGGKLLPAGSWWVRFAARGARRDQIPEGNRPALFGDGPKPARLTRAELSALAANWSNSPLRDGVEIVLDYEANADEVDLFRGGNAPVDPFAMPVLAVNAPHEPMPYSFWYGNPHSHSTRSDGGGSACGGSCSSSSTRVNGAYPDDAYVIADRAEAACPTNGGGLDWLMVAEHDHLLDDASQNDTRAPIGPGQLIPNQIYAQGRAYASAATTPGFVGLYGLEYSTISNCGHVNIYDAAKFLMSSPDPTMTYLVAPDVPVPACQYADAGDLYDLANQPANRSQTTNLPHLVLNHPDPDDNHFENFKRTAFSDAVVRGVAVISGSATSCDSNFPGGGTVFFDGGTLEYKDVYIQLLTAGWQVAPEGHQDNHGDNFGNHSEVRTVVLSENLTKECLLKAQFNRRIYATQDRDGQLILTGTPVSNSVKHYMGEAIGGNGGVAFHASWWQPDNDVITSYRLLRGQVGGGCNAFSCLTVVATGFSGTPVGAQTIDFTESGLATGNYYYLVEIQQPGKYCGNTNPGCTLEVRHTVSAAIFVNYAAVDTGVTPATCGCVPPTVAPSATPSSGCGTVSSTLAANASGGTAPYTYLWSTGATTSTINVSPSSTTTYTVTVTGGPPTSCASAATPITVTVGNPIVAPSATPSTICTGGTSQLAANPSGGAGSYTFVWSPPTGLSSTTAQNPTASPAGTTVYTVTATDSIGCVSPSAQVTVTVSPSVPPAPPTGVTAHGEPTQTVVRWTNPVAGTNTIYRAAGNCSAGSYALVQTQAGAAGANSWTDTSVSSGVSYCYKVYLENGGCVSPASACGSDSCTTPGGVPEVSGSGAVERFKIRKVGGGAELRFEWRGSSYKYHLYGVGNEAGMDAGNYGYKYCDLAVNGLGTWVTDSATYITWTMADIAQLPAANLMIVAELAATEGPYGYKSSGTRRTGDSNRQGAVQSGCAVVPSVLLSQNWTNTALITTDDNWTNPGLAGIVGYRGDVQPGGTGVDPQTLLGEGTIVIDVDAQAAVTSTTGGVGEFDLLANPVVGFQGSGTAEAPSLILPVNTTGFTDITVSYNLRDIDSTADNAAQQVALQYRVGSTGLFTNVPLGYVSDATTGPSIATLVTPVSVVLPAAANNQSLVQIRVITTDAVGSDEWVGVDDIVVTGI